MLAAEVAHRVGSVESLAMSRIEVPRALAVHAAVDARAPLLLARGGLGVLALLQTFLLAFLVVQRARHLHQLVHLREYTVGHANRSITP